MGLLKGLMINQGPAQARIRRERGLYWAERRRGDGCYSMGWAGAFQARAGGTDEAGRRVVAPQADSSPLQFPPISPHLILSAGTSMPTGHYHIYPTDSIAKAHLIFRALFPGP